MIASEGIAHRSVRSGFWLLLRRGAANAIRLFALAILARKLTPGEFGLAALAQVLVQFLTLAEATGLGAYVIVDRAEGRERRVHTAFWLNIGLTGLQVGLSLLLVPLVARFYTQPGLVLLLVVLIAAFALKQMTVVPDALLQREMRHDLLVTRDTLLDLLGAGTSVVLALRGFGVWSLVLPTIAVQPFRLISAFRLAGFRPGPPVSEGWKPMARYCGHLTGTQLLSLLANDGDTLLIGKLLGSVALGFYNVAWQLSNLTTRNLSAVVSAVAMPALALVAEQTSRLRAAYLRMLRLLAAVTFPALASLFVVAQEVVLLVYGPRWLAAVPLLRILLLFGLVRAVTSPTQVIYNVVGKPEAGLWITIGFAPAYLASIFLGSYYGLEGIAWGVTGSRILCALVSLFVSTHFLQMRFLSCLAALARIAVATTTALVAALLLHASPAVAELPAAARLAGCTGLAAVVYLPLLRRLDREAYDEILGLLRGGATRARVWMTTFAPRAPEGQRAAR